MAQECPHRALGAMDILASEWLTGLVLMELWVGCVAGALADDEYRKKLHAAGFESIEVEPTRVYDVEDAREFLSTAGLDVNTIASQDEGKFESAFVRAQKPAKGTACRGPTCCQS